MDGHAHDELLELQGELHDGAGQEAAREERPRVEEPTRPLQDEALAQDLLEDGEVEVGLGTVLPNVHHGHNGLLFTPVARGFFERPAQPPEDERLTVAPTALELHHPRRFVHGHAHDRRHQRAQVLLLGGKQGRARGLPVLPA